MIEIVIVVAIAMLVMMLAVPSITGVLADKHLRTSLDRFNDLVRRARELSVTEHRPYLIVWGDQAVALRPEAFAKDEEEKATAIFPMSKDRTVKLTLPAALQKEVPAEWIFWPSGNCEPAVVEFTGRDGEWKAQYSPLTARAELLSYVAR